MTHSRRPVQSHPLDPSWWEFTLWFIEEPCVHHKVLFLFNIKSEMPFSVSTVKLSECTELVWIWGIGVVGRPSVSLTWWLPIFCKTQLFSSSYPGFIWDEAFKMSTSKFFLIENRILWSCNCRISGFLLLSFCDNACLLPPCRLCCAYCCWFPKKLFVSFLKRLCLWRTLYFLIELLGLNCTLCSSQISRSWSLV